MGTTQPLSREPTLKDLHTFTQEELSKYKPIESWLDEDAKRVYVTNQALARPDKVGVVTSNLLCAGEKTRRPVGPMSFTAYSDDDDDTLERNSADWKKFDERAREIHHDCDTIINHKGTDMLFFNDRYWEMDYGNHPACQRFPDHVATSNALKYIGTLPTAKRESFEPLGFHNPFEHKSMRRITESYEKDGETVEKVHDELDQLAVISNGEFDVPEPPTMVRSHEQVVWIKTVNEAFQDLIDSQLPEQWEGWKLDGEGKDFGVLLENMQVKLTIAAQEAGRKIADGSVVYDEASRSFKGITKYTCDASPLRGVPSERYRQTRSWMIPVEDGTDREVKLVHGWYVPPSEKASTEGSK